MDSNLKSYLKTPNPNKVFVLIGPNSSGKSYVCNRIIQKFVNSYKYKCIQMDMYSNIDYDTISSQIQSATIQDYFSSIKPSKTCTTHKRYTYILYIDALETFENPKSVFDSIFKIMKHNNNIYIIVNTTNSLLIPKNTMCMKYYMNTSTSSKTIPNIHKVFECKTDTFYTIPFKTIQLLLYCWKHKKDKPKRMNTLLNTNMYLCNPNQITGFIFDEYIKLTNNLYSIETISDILSNIALFETYRDSFTLHKIVEYMYIFGISSVYTSQINTNHSLKHFYPIYNSKMIQLYNNKNILKKNVNNIEFICEIMGIFNIHCPLFYRKLFPKYVKNIYDYNNVLKLYNKKEIKISKKHITNNKVIKKNTTPTKVIKKDIYGKTFKIVKTNQKKQKIKQEIVDTKDITKTEKKNEISVDIKDTLNKYTIKQLIELCKKEKIKNYSKYKLKKDLITFIETFYKI